MTTNETRPDSRLAAALAAEDPSVRLRAALAAGSDPDPGLLDGLVERCAVEPDSFVRDMLSWALTRLPPGSTLPRLRRELVSERSQARSQALHTLSKIGEKSARAWITRDTLRDVDDEVARTAWRVAVALAPDDEQERGGLVDELVTQLGRGGPTVQSSLSRALVALGNVIEPALERAAADPDPAVADHARATGLLLQHPETGLGEAVEEAKRVVALGRQRAAAPAAGVAGTAGTAGPAQETGSRAAAPAEDAEPAGC